MHEGTLFGCAVLYGANTGSVADANVIDCLHVQLRVWWCTRSRACIWMRIGKNVSCSAVCGVAQASYIVSSCTDLGLFSVILCVAVQTALSFRS